MSSHIEKYSAAVAERLEESGERVDIGIIMELVMTLIDTCFESESQLRAAAEDPNPLQLVGLRIMVRQTLRRNRSKRPKPKLVRKLVNEMLAELDETSEESLKIGFGEARLGLGRFAGDR